MDRYRVFSNADKDGQRRWYHACVQRKIPYIQVLNRSKLAKVEWDYITLPSDLDNAVFDREDEISSALQDIYKSAAGPKRSYYGSAVVGYMDNMAIESAEPAAAKIAGLFERILSQPK
ncbi:hypothetical protein CXF92_18720 [Pseudomonas sp. Choline-3u-10]|uniref:Uncharacterized protein n=1 Tax=viral metagenome TaxID=1070528 RepID=A0A6M3XAI0_9ZZZZ|nr:hypothetical protein CXF92_18720 [Pseudomonas sp. Choline-3u-10]|tara:strand:- start:1761 stop:2114 length:354 start_codon:yes stop_codon:yes gene_type:complete